MYYSVIGSIPPISLVPRELQLVGSKEEEERTLATTELRTNRNRRGIRILGAMELWKLARRENSWNYERIGIGEERMTWDFTNRWWIKYICRFVLKNGNFQLSMGNGHSQLFSPLIMQSAVHTVTEALSFSRRWTNAVLVHEVSSSLCIIVIGRSRMTVFTNKPTNVLNSPLISEISSHSFFTDPYSLIIPRVLSSR